MNLPISGLYDPGQRELICTYGVNEDPEQAAK